MAKIFPSKKGLGYFGVQRFDRKEKKRIHMHTLAILIHADHREPSLDYETLMKVTLYLIKDVRQFRNAVFNILTHNRDDHAKNFSFLIDENGIWKVSPAYDLTYSSGPGGEHSSTIMGEGKNPKKAHLMKLAAVGGILVSKAHDIIAQVINAVKKWKMFALEAGVSKGQTSNKSLSPA